MGQLSVRLVFFLLCTQLGFSQDTLCVYKAKGMSLLEIGTKQSTLKKGALIGDKDVVKVLPNAEITALDNFGNSYLINVEGTYGLKHLLNFKVKQNTSNFTASYFKHVWQEIKSKENKKALIAGVFRGETLMAFPKDKTKLASSKITLKWDLEQDINLYYVFIKNVITEEILKIETNGSHLALYDDNPIFFYNDTFEWTVTTDAFPNLNNIPFVSFKLIDRNIYEELKKEFTDFIQDLETLGHSEKEIESILCKSYGLCK